MSKFTPGPWRAERWMEDSPSARLLGPHGEIIASFLDVREEGPANLQLAHAAPDLLEWSKAILEPHLQASAYGVVRCNLAAAIAKAEGE